MNKKFLLLNNNFFILITITICFIGYFTFAWGKTNLSDLEYRVLELEHKLQNNLSLEMANKLDCLQQEIQELRGIIEEQQNLLARINLTVHQKTPSALDKNSEQSDSTQLKVDKSKQQ